MIIDLLGLPFDANSSYVRGPAKAPQAIRSALRSDSSNSWAEDGLDLGAEGVLCDLGDVQLEGNVSHAFTTIESVVRSKLANGDRVISLGGDHSVTLPIMKAMHASHSDISILHLDAHPDLYHEFDGNKFSHACPFARIMERRLARRLVQVGIRTLNAHQREQASLYGVEVITMRHLDKLSSLALEGPLYVSLDLDVLDPAFAPGVSHHEPGGMSVRDIIEIIQSLRVPVVGADIVEFNPTRDIDGRTAMVAAKLVKEIAAAMVREGKPARDDWP